METTMNILDLLAKIIPVLVGLVALYKVASIDFGGPAKSNKKEKPTIKYLVEETPLGLFLFVISFLGIILALNAFPYLILWVANISK